MGWGSSLLDAGINFAGAIPAYGTAISLGAAAGHAINGVSAYMDGDMEGAQDEGTSAVLSGISAIPAFGTGAGIGMGLWDTFATGSRLAGASDNDAPTSSQAISDMIFDGALGIHSGENSLEGRKYGFN